MMMNSNRIFELYTRKLASEAGKEELEELETLLDASGERAQYEEQFRKLELLKVASPFSDPELAFARHHQKYFSDSPDADSCKAAPRGIRTFITPWLVAASIVLCLLVAGLYFGTRNGAYDIYIGKGEKKRIILPDSTVVWLNSDTRLSYRPASPETKFMRMVTLSGEAFFDVHHDKAHPFVINTGKYDVKVLGTAFNIKAYPKDETSETSLIRGKIELSFHEAPGTKVQLRPRQKMELKTGGEYQLARKRGSYNIQLIEPMASESKKIIPETAWVNNQLTFNNDNFESCARKLERWFNIRINITNDKLKQRHFTGVFEDENISEVLDAMKLISPFTYRIINNEVIIE